MSWQETLQRVLENPGGGRALSPNIYANPTQSLSVNPVISVVTGTGNENSPASSGWAEATPANFNPMSGPGGMLNQQADLSTGTYDTTAGTDDLAGILDDIPLWAIAAGAVAIGLLAFGGKIKKVKP